ncbi:hypothetical protein KAU88_06835 [Candidatus Bathyarchaeota archaeon]|nr:hypothetical protein [Candidatus Bathyarchaeota archaeon]
MNDFDTNKREKVLKCGTLGAIIVNNEYLGAGPLQAKKISKNCSKKD